MMYKPLSLVISKTNREFERNSLFRVSSPQTADESRNNTRHLFRQAKKSAQSTEATGRSTVVTEAKSQDLDFATSVSRPRCIKSYRTDRVAIYDEQDDTFHAYSITESISQPGLSFQEAVDWVDERLVLVGNGIGPGNFAVAISMIIASWVVAILIISSIVRFVF